MPPRFLLALPAAVSGGAMLSVAAAQSPAGPDADWRAAEAPALTAHVRLTSPQRFARAGEAYFSPDGGRIIFQAIEKPQTGDFYAMYVAEVRRDAAGRIAGLRDVRRISPPGSFNTCGWFHPTDPDTVIFASTLEAPGGEAPGYQRSGRDYRWRFPPEMDIYRFDLADPDARLEPLVVNPDAYLAECSLSADGRLLLYTSLESNDGDLYVRDLRADRSVRLVGAAGYDGGPFFSPRGRRICYRSDRRGDDLLQIFVGELAFGPGGTPTGVQREYQLTANGAVNFAPFWHPDGRHVAYVSSVLGHHNYEIFIVDADSGETGPIRYGTGRRRVTRAAGFDGFPAFDREGSVLIWTSQRDESRTSQVWAAAFEMPEAP